MKSIRECSREERLERALLALECLSYLFDEDCITKEQFSSDVYMIAHAAPGRCGNPHEDWLKKIEEVEDHARKFNHYNAEKILEKTKTKNIGVGVGVLVRKDGQMLVGRRTETVTTGAGCYAMPGGNVEFGETWADCGEREVYEETGMRVKVVPYKGQPYMWVSEHFFNEGKHHYIVIWLLANWIEGEPKTLEPSKVEGWTWATLKDLHALIPLDGDHREWLPLDILEQLDLGI